MKRRQFIKRLAGTGIVLPFALGYPSVRAFAKAPGGSPFTKLMSSSNDRIMVLIRLAGGNDGLNTVVPYTNDIYYTSRKKGSADDLSIAKETVKKLSGSSTLGLHPSLEKLIELYDEGKMTIVQNVGYEGQNFSHFRSTDIWLSGSDATVYDDAGWYAKYLEEKYPDYPGVLPSDPFAIELGTYLSTTLIGENQNMGVAVADLSYIPGQPDPDPVRSTHAGEEEAYVREIARQSNIFSNSIIAAGTKQLTNKVTYPNNALAMGLAPIARLIAAGLGTQMYIINVGGYDTHSNQLTAQATLHQNFATAVHAFQRDLEAFGIDDKVCVMTQSEFGRRAASNGTGTDHGSAAPLFVMGKGVIGGIIGHDPNLTDLEKGNIKMQYDFRQIYASVLSQWYGATTDQLMPALPREFEQLPIFDTLPSSGVALSGNSGSSLTLGQNFPNPASNGTSFPIDGVPSGSDARFTIYSIDGSMVHTEQVVAGQQEVKFDTRSLSTGSYVYELTVNGLRQTKTMTVAR